MATKNGFHCLQIGIDPKLTMYQVGMIPLDYLFIHNFDISTHYNANYANLFQLTQAEVHLQLPCTESHVFGGTDRFD